MDEIDNKAANIHRGPMIWFTLIADLVLFLVFLQLVVIRKTSKNQQTVTLLWGHIILLWRLCGVW